MQTSGSSEVFTWSDTQYADNGGGLNFTFFKLPDTIKVCQSNTNTDLSDYVVGENVKWYSGFRDDSALIDAPTIDNRNTGLFEYWVTQTIDECESDKVPLIYLVQSKPTIQLVNDTTICEGDTIELNTNLPYLDHAWNNGERSHKITITEPGEYEVIVTDDIGCADTSAMNLGVNPLPEVDLGDDAVICEGTSLTLNANNEGLNHAWNTGASSQKISINQAGIYGVVVTDDIGCMGSDSMELATNPMPEVDLGNDTSICAGASVTLDAQNEGFNYEWSNGAETKTIEVTETIDLSVIVRDEIGCADTSSISIEVRALPIVDLGNDTTICVYQSLQLDAGNEGLNFSWTNGGSSQMITVTEPGLYGVQVTDEIGCEGADEIYVDQEIISDLYIDKNKVVCEGAMITLSPDFPVREYNVYWYEDIENSSIEVAETGVYNSVVEGRFCKDTFAIQVTKIDTPDIEIVDVKGLDHYCFDMETTWLEIVSDENDLTYYWDDFGRADEVEITEAGNYNLEVSNDHCSSRFSYSVEEYCEGLMYIPNAFSPRNQDGLNDVFKPVSNNHIENYEFRIYNRWGEQIFYSNNIDEGWDGTFNGNFVLVDAYLYKVTYDYISEYEGVERKQITGTVIVLN